jgi:hypothetical protein
LSLATRADSHMYLRRLARVTLVRKCETAVGGLLDQPVDPPA